MKELALLVSREGGTNCGGAEMIKPGAWVYWLKKNSEKVVEVRRRCDRVMGIGLVFGEEVVRVICAYAQIFHSVENQIQRKSYFMRKWRVSGVWQMQMKWCWD